MEETFSEKDLEFISKRGNSLEKIMQQLHYFRNGIPKINLYKSATIGDGILCPDTKEKKQWAAYFDEHKSKYDVQKFVPASGAATRMFQFLNEFLNRFNPETDTINSYVNKYNDTNLPMFIVGIRNFPFYTELKEKTRELFPAYSEYNSDKKVHAIITTLLDTKGLNFANKPKGVLPFHIKEELIETPIDEHVWEASFYAREHKKTKIHFTVSIEFQNDFERILSKYPNIEASFSYQDQTSDTIAVHADNTPFRLEDGSLFFRPGGHGALIENLNQLTSDLIFIKNIDNVSQIEINELIENKKVLGGILIHTQFHVFKYLNILQEETCSKDDIAAIKSFVEMSLSFPLPEDFHKFKTEYQQEYLIKILHRPIRVCGMVRNEGEPGGGPFWVKDDKGRLSLQIVESSQIDLTDKTQKNILHHATHFNPVDIVCGVKDYQGNKFDLHKFVDPNAAFITEKTKLGKPIKAFELPGLWNGSMAKWSTIFVEVPLATFNPVKTVNDLLKPAHQASHE